MTWAYTACSTLLTRKEEREKKSIFFSLFSRRHLTCTLQYSSRVHLGSSSPSSVKETFFFPLARRLCSSWRLTFTFGFVTASAFILLEERRSREAVWRSFIKLEPNKLAGRRSGKVDGSLIHGKRVLLPPDEAVDNKYKKNRKKCITYIPWTKADWPVGVGWYSWMRPLNSRRTALKLWAPTPIRAGSRYPKKTTGFRSSCCATAVGNQLEIHRWSSRARQNWPSCA